MVQIHGVPAAVRAVSTRSSSSDSSNSPNAIATSIQVDESNEDSSKRQKVTDGPDMELEGLVRESERDRLQRYSDFELLMQVKQNADVYLDRIFSNDHHLSISLCTGWSPWARGSALPQEGQVLCSTRQSTVVGLDTLPLRTPLADSQLHQDVFFCDDMT